MWTVSINSAINDGQNAHYDESCSSTLASTFSNGAKDPNTGVVSRTDRELFVFYELFRSCANNEILQTRYRYHILSVIIEKIGETSSKSSCSSREMFRKR